MKLYLIGIILHAGFADDTFCKSGQTGFDGSCYEILDSIMTWREANEACAAQGGELVVPNSQSEQEYIWEMCRGSGVKGDVWVGCTRDQQEKWVYRGDECTYFNWKSVEPEFWDCAVMSDWGNGLWDDDSCSFRNSVICEHSYSHTPSHTGVQPYTQVNMTCLMADYNGRFAATE